jgi:hypothetical protein
LPKSAVLGRNSAGHDDYSLCPRASQYAVLLYALQRKLPVRQGFDPEALVEGKLVHLAEHEGETFISYGAS